MLDPLMGHSTGDCILDSHCHCMCRGVMIVVSNIVNLAINLSYSVSNGASHEHVINKLAIVQNASEESPLAASLFLSFAFQQSHLFYAFGEIATVEWIFD